MMPATESEPASMEDSHAVENEKGSLMNVPPLAAPSTVPPPAPPLPTAKKNFTGETGIENRAVSMASIDCSSALSSPTEASPAKPAVTSPTTFEGTSETSPATSHIASASDSLRCTGTSLDNTSGSLPLLSGLPSAPFGHLDPEKDFSPTLTLNGVTVTLENNSVWKQFHSYGTEMILTKQGRRMFPYCRYRLTGLHPERYYSLVLSIDPFDKYKYRWNKSKWEVYGSADQHAQHMVRSFSHHYLSCKGSNWMGSLVSFYKLKLTNNFQSFEDHIILHSMHRYITKLHVIPVPDGGALNPYQDLGPESMTFTFPQTEFMAVTTYQNYRITQLKINHNPFAKGFREDGNYSRLNRSTTEIQPLVRRDLHPPVSEQNESKDEAIDLSMKNHTVPAPPSNVQENRLVLKPIMSSPATKDEPYVSCIRGKHALGELVLVQQRPNVKSKEGNCTPKGICRTSTSSASKCSPWNRRRKKKLNRRWANSRGKDRKTAAATAPPTVVHSPSLSLALQPELDDVEGLMFVSFISKEALEVHVMNKPANNSASISPVSPTTQKKIGDVIETDEAKIARFEAILLQDFRALKHRQVIHPVLQEVGLKLCFIDPTKSIDLQYLGVLLPLPPLKLPEEGDALALSLGEKKLPFISRTGKTSDVTKIKGWKNKFIKSKQTSPSVCDGLQRNLSAFCSNMLDEYLESEAQQISERAAAFSTNPEGSVVYQLPAKSSSYVKTLDSALRHRNAASKLPLGANKPCPLSHKPLLYAALTSPVPPLASPTPVQANAASQRSSTSLPGFSQRPTTSHGQNQGLAHRTAGFTKFQFKLLQMEIASLNQGESRTQLTPERLSVALSVILTKEMLPNQKLPKCLKYKVGGPECGQEFCRLGCVCSSLQHFNRGPLHCRRPECMFGCACFKRKITKICTGESKKQIQPLYSINDMEDAVQPHPGSHTKILWDRNIHDLDPEPLFVPQPSLCLVPSKAPKRSVAPRPTQPIREEDKDPVYKYLESMMTCARVREFNSIPPPEVTIEPKILHTSTPNTNTKLQKITTEDLRRQDYITETKKAADGTCQESTNETEARKQIQIHSACQWDKDRKMVLEALYQRMNQNKLSQRFYIGPYRIRPISKVYIQKPSGSIITYRVHISKPSKASDNEEDENDDSEEDSKSFEDDVNALENLCQFEESEIHYGVTPFLGGVLPAGRLRARTKPVGCQANGLIQVNSKSYNQARLLLGTMGSLHPANRLAAYVTGRLHAPTDTSNKCSQKPAPTQQCNTLGTLRLKAAGTVVPPVVISRKTADLKIPTQVPAQVQPNTWRKGFTTLPLHLQESSTLHPAQMFISSQRSSVSSFQNSSKSSPVSLTVSPSLKTPSFLGQSGTYSFRICPPTSQSTTSQNLPGVALPGGFTLIQLPNPGTDGAAQHAGTVNAKDMATVDKAPPQREPLLNFGHLAAKLDAVQSVSSSELMCDEKMPTDESDEANCRKVQSSLDIPSDGLSSDSSDYCVDEDEEPVDIETVEVGQEMAISKMREAAMRRIQESRDSSDDFGSSREFTMQDQMDECKDTQRRKYHIVVERQRRSEQRNLFNKLQTVLRSDPKASRHHLLSLALKEIQKLVETSRCLEEEKRRLIEMQAVYVKELSLLSGRSENMIQHKLKDICKRQKTREKTMKLRPFSHLLQSRAALLQATQPDSSVKSTPLLQPDFCVALSTSQRNAPQMMYPLRSNLPKSQVSNFEDQEEATKAPAPRVTQCQVPSVPTSQATSAQEGNATVSSTSNSRNSVTRTTQPLTLPLIRSKTGRIILPSCLKPIGNGFYRLMFMKAKPNGEVAKVNTSANMHPSDVGSKNQKSFATSDNPSVSESKCVPEEGKTTPSKFDSKHLSAKIPLTELGLLHKSIQGPLKPVEDSREKDKVAGLNKPVSADCLSFKRTHQVHPLTEAEDPNTSVVQRRQGRPRKNSVHPVSENEKCTVVEKPRKSQSKMDIQVEVKQSERSSFDVPERRAKGISVMVSDVADSPVPAKRRRGRPPKRKRKKAAHRWGPDGQESPSKSDEDSPVRLYRPFKSPDTQPMAASTLSGAVNTSRPLTRSALGKDFPSAKKRSWVDIEKELEPELEYE
ncbi:MAX gene-associated protein [Echeneis naucrates]|uniref:MAX gene-associated protein n=1 Tax=Echeneis naucrates TaxID=173247 RepID=UPI001113A7C3|nr:MAX gene-associated protein-like [Echeneis naucrates]